MATDDDWVEEVRRWLQPRSPPAGRQPPVAPAAGTEDSESAVKQQQAETPANAASTDQTLS